MEQQLLHFMKMRTLASVQAWPVLPRLVSNVLGLGNRSLITAQYTPDLKKFAFDVHGVLLVRV
jgi:hypothetical protein